MFKLKNGSLRTVIYNESDLNSYIQAGWSLVEEEVKKEPKAQENSKEKSDEVNEQNNSRRKTNKK